MLNKVSIILKNFFKTSKLNEKLEIFLIPLIITLLCLLLCGSIDKLDDFLSNFNNTMITVSSLLVAFGVASITMLVTSTSKNVDDAKKYITERIDINKKKISYYKLIIIRGFFSLFVLFFVLIIAILMQFWNCTIFNKCILFIELYLLLVSVFTQMFLVSSLYFLLSKQE